MVVLGMIRSGKTLDVVWKHNTQNLRDVSEGEESRKFLEGKWVDFKVYLKIIAQLA